MTDHVRDLERRLAIFDYNAAVDLSRASFIPSIRAECAERAQKIAEELGWI